MSKKSFAFLILYIVVTTLCYFGYSYSELLIRTDVIGEGLTDGSRILLMVNFYLWVIGWLILILFIGVTQGLLALLKKWNENIK